MDNCKFQLGDIVTIASGDYSGITGAVFKQPNALNKEHYTIITEDRPYGYWATEDELTEAAMPITESKELRSSIYYQKAGRNDEYDKYIPIDQDPNIWMMEMADINRSYTKNSGCGFKVTIEPNEGLIPHVHVRFNNGSMSHIKLGKAEYLNGHEKKDHILTSDEKKELQKFFNAKIPTHDKHNEMTSWEFAVTMWASNIDTDEKMRAFNAAFEYDNDKMIMPDYTELA